MPSTGVGVESPQPATRHFNLREMLISILSSMLHLPQVSECQVPGLNG